MRVIVWRSDVSIRERESVYKAMWVPERISALVSVGTQVSVCLREREREREGEGERVHVSWKERQRI